jgi:adenosylmethionine-8-amino-7-oxononanoate aminotransferase
MKIDHNSKLFFWTGQERPMVERAEGIYLWDTNGNRYLDASSGPMISNLGHSNPRVLEAMKAQMEKATFAYRLYFQNEVAEQLADKAITMLPPGLDRLFLVSGGSEAVESCLKLARQYVVTIGQEQRWKVISLTPSFHGTTLGALSVTGMPMFTEQFAPMMAVMPKIPAPTCYLDQDNLSDEERGLKYAENLRIAIEREGAQSVLAFIMEPVGGASTGALVAPASFYRRVREICDEHGILLIADEVLTGAGRTGRFLGSEHWDLRPDIVAMAKGFAAGYAPLGAMAARGDIVGAIMAEGVFAHGHTYGANPLACAAGLAVLTELQETGLIENARIQGDKLKAALKKLQQRYEIIGDVRGKGLLLAFELVADRNTMEPLPAEFNAHVLLVEEAFQRGLIIYSRRTRGTSGDHFLICPPFIINDSQIDEIIDKLSASLDALVTKLELAT